MRGKAGLFSRFQPLDPLTIPGLTGWWDASDSGSLFDADTGGSAATADGDVGRIQDKSGNNRHFTQATAADRPRRKTSVQNGLDVVRFDGATEYLELGLAWSTLIAAAAGSVFIVAKATTITTNEADVWDNQAVLTDAGLWHGFFVVKSTGAALSFANATSSDPEVSVSYTAGNWAIFSTWHDGTNINARINRGSVVSTALGTRTNLSGNTVLMGTTNDQSDGGYTPKFFDGDVGEIITSNQALTLGDRQQVESYLADKWNI